MAVISSAFLLVAALLFAPILILTLSRRSRKKKKSLPSPRGLPIIGNLHQLGLRPHRTLQALAARHGPLMLLRLGSIPTLVVSSAAAARSVLQTHDLAFSDRPRLAAGERLIYGCRDVAFAPYGEYWRQARRVCVLHLLSARRVRAARAIREQEVAALVGRLKQKVEGLEPESATAEVNVSKAIIALTNDITCRVAVGMKYNPGQSGGSGDELGGSGGGPRELLEEFLSLLGRFNVADYIPWLAGLNKINGLDAQMDRIATQLDRFFEKVIHDHLARAKTNSGTAGGDGDDGMDFVDVLLSLLEATQGENDTSAGAGGEFCLDEKSVKALILDMFAAGTHTTFTVIDWAMAELMVHPEVMKKLQKEVRLIGKGKPMLNEDDIKNTSYLDIVIKEVLRLHTPIPLLVARKNIEDIELDGYDIPKGTLVFINAWAIAKDPNQWERPEDFWPERFTDGGVNADFYGLDFQLIPFGAGRRGCPGIQFALPTIKLVIANLLYIFDWEFPNRDKGFQLDMTEASASLAAHRQHSLILVAKPYW